MKKVFLTLILALVSQQSLACLGEAEISARVYGTSLVGSTSCTVTVDPASVEVYVQNPACPLDFKAVSKNGFEVGVRREDICAFDYGDKVSGKLVQDASGTIFLQY